MWKVINPKSDVGTIKIGAVLPLSGPVAFMGKGTLNGLMLAQEHANNGEWGKLPFKIEIIAEDGGGIPRNSIGAYQKLQYTGDTHIMVSTLSSVCMALRPLAEKDGILFFANASHPQLTTGRGTIFRHSNVASQEAQVIIKDMLTASKLLRASIVVQNDDYGVAFAKTIGDNLRAVNVGLAESIVYDREGFDARVISQQSIAKQPDAVVLVGVGKDLGLLIRRHRELGFKGNIYASLGFVLVPGAVEAAGKYAEDVKHTNFVFDENDSKYKQVYAAYLKRFGTVLGADALISYNTVYFLCEVARKAGSHDPKVLSSRIQEMSSFKAPGEMMVITHDRDILPQLEVTQFKKR